MFMKKGVFIAKFLNLAMATLPNCTKKTRERNSRTQIRARFFIQVPQSGGRWLDRFSSLNDPPWKDLKNIRMIGGRQVGQEAR